MVRFQVFFGITWLLISLLIPVSIMVAGIIDFHLNRELRRTLPRFLIASALYPFLMALSILGVAMIDEKARSLTGASDFDIQAKIFLIFFLLAYVFCGIILVAFVAQKLPFLRQAFNPVEENFPSVFNKT